MYTLACPPIQSGCKFTSGCRLRFRGNDYISTDQLHGMHAQRLSDRCSPHRRCEQPTECDAGPPLCFDQGASMTISVPMDYTPVAPMRPRDRGSKERDTPGAPMGRWTLDTYWSDKLKPMSQPWMFEPFDSTGDAVCDAALACDFEAIRLLIRDGASPNSRADNGWPALGAACGFGHHASVAVLLACHADPNISMKSGGSPLSIAAAQGDLACVGMLLAAGATANLVQREDGASPLHLACRAIHADVVERLIDAGAFVNTPTSDGLTPLAEVMAVNANEALPNARASQPGEREACARLLIGTPSAVEPRQSNLSSRISAVEAVTSLDELLLFCLPTP